MRWLLIGASTIAEEHMIGALRRAGQEVAAVHSAGRDRAKDFAARLGIATAGTDLDALLRGARIDAVYISSTNEKHADQAMRAIAAGKHVLCEKPLATSRADSVAMARAAEAAGLVFATNHHLRSSGSHRAIRDLVAAGRIGRVLSLRRFSCSQPAGAPARLADRRRGRGRRRDPRHHRA